MCKQVAEEDDDFILCEDCLSTLNSVIYETEMFRGETIKEKWNVPPTFYRLSFFMPLLYYRSGRKEARFVNTVKDSGIPQYGIYAGELIGRRLKVLVDIEKYDYSIPLPILKGRQKKRGYNQSELLCIGIEKQTGLKFRTDILENKGKERESSDDLSRRKDLRTNKFVCTDKVSDIKGKRIVLVDDMVTNGQTISDVMKVLITATDGDITIALASMAVSPILYNKEPRCRDKFPKYRKLI